MFRYAPGLTVLKIIQIGLSAVLAPLSIYFTQQIIDTVSGIITNGGSWNSLVPWLALLIFAMFFSSLGGGFLNGILYISIKRKLNIGMTPDVVEKFKRIDYACFEDKDIQDTLQRMSSDPQDKVFQLFLTECRKKSPASKRSVGGGMNCDLKTAL
jgi:ABC-type bacteriocin/lantibiotic exporter with double-glycine peptidase domain